MFRKSMKFFFLGPSFQGQFYSAKEAFPSGRTAERDHKITGECYLPLGQSILSLLPEVMKTGY